MELLPIGEDKLKVTLSPQDMENYRLQADADWDDTGTRKALWSILDEAKKRCGFDAARERVLVQIFPSPAGGCEMFVTRVGGHADPDTDEVRLPDPPLKERLGSRACFFDELRDMLAFCRLLCDSGYKGESEAYICEDGRPLLIYCGGDIRAAEYGSVTDIADIEYYICEHAEMICRENAVETLAKLN